MSRFFLIISLVFISLLSDLHAQFVDSIRACLNKKPKLSLRLDNRNAFVAYYKERIVGIKIGVEFDTRFRVGGGYNFLDSRLSKPQLIYNAGAVADTVESVLKMSYFGYYIEYVFYRTKHWEFGIPIQLGFGNSRFDYAYLGKSYKTDRRFILVYESSIAGHYKIFPWIGIGAGIGYQLMLVGNPYIPENFNSPIYVLKLKIFLGDIYYTLFPEGKK